MVICHDTLEEEGEVDKAIVLIQFRRLRDWVSNFCRIVDDNPSSFLLVSSHLPNTAQTTNNTILLARQGGNRRGKMGFVG